MKTANNETRQQILAKARTIIAGKSYAAVGLNEILAAAAVPKGSFYHYFASKDQFGEALLKEYFEAYLCRMDEILFEQRGSGAERLMRYWTAWAETQSSKDQEQMCLAVKLGAEVCDLSEAMREALRRGTQKVIDRIALSIEQSEQDGSLKRVESASQMAAILYELWVGASLLEKIHRDGRFFEATLKRTVMLLGT